ncbi:hypothetical protein F5876DRAFT_63672 [Lentinula aff. lateritia]|uniref:Uncharacterized protein n=1 Tax=Lentinula aff. lateritia TaxID=2804960 RepID=A0ACC1U6X3_9AGAR|nr:hypothetical protein F5876DRAFT_63672 [Lentinula aff. lateritia]
MSPEEIALLQQAGLTLGRNGSVLLLIGILYVLSPYLLNIPGIYVTLVILALNSLLRRGFTRNAAIWALLVGVVVTFTMTTAYSALYFQIFFGFFRVAFIENSSQSFESRLDIAEDSIANFLIGDAVSVWRVWAICSSNRRFIILPIIMFLGGLGLSIGFNSLNTPPPPFVFTFSTLWDLQLLGLILPLATNVFATVLIGYQTYLYHGFIKANLSTGRSKAGSIMILLTESGAVYCTIQAIYVTLVLTDDAPLSSPQDQATRLYGQFALFVSAMIPLLVILIVYNQRSITDTVHGSYSGGTAPAISQYDPGTHISFANRVPFSSGTGHSNIEGESTDVQSNNPINDILNNSSFGNADEKEKAAKIVASDLP